MKVYKFGGACLKDSAGLWAMAEILSHEKGEMALVVSAMGKTTNALEKLVPEISFLEAEKIIEEIEEFHYKIVENTITGKYKDELLSILKETSESLRGVVKKYLPGNYDKRYDNIVSLGEILSGNIVTIFLAEQGINLQLALAGNFICTDDNFRDANVDFEKTERKVKKAFSKGFEKHPLLLTQGFIGKSVSGKTTTLGREGSDYTAAIIAHCLDAESLTIWKDVPGVLNADPKRFKDTVKIDHLSYQDAIEMAYYGATVIHPKTIKPLQNKNIPLYVKSFTDWKAPGTVIDSNGSHLSVPCYISKPNQVLLSLSPKDFSFIAEENMSHIFETFSRHKVKVNMLQHSALNLSVCIDNDGNNTGTAGHVLSLLESFKADYRVLYNEDAELFTIRYYNQQTIDKVCSGRTVLLEQRSRYTVQLVVK